MPQPVPVRNIQLRERLPEGRPPITRDYPLFNTFHPTWGLHVQSCVVDAILDEKPYPVRMLVVQSGNPAVTMTDSNRVRKALEKLEFLVVIDLFMTQTAKLADVVLPATSCFEKTQLNRSSLRNNLVVLQDQVIDWLGESWPDWKIIFELGGGWGWTGIPLADGGRGHRLPVGTVRDHRGEAAGEPGGDRCLEDRVPEISDRRVWNPLRQGRTLLRAAAGQGHGRPLSERVAGNPISFADRSRNSP